MVTLGYEISTGHLQNIGKDVAISVPWSDIDLSTLLMFAVRVVEMESK